MKHGFHASGPRLSIRQESPANRVCDGLPPGLKKVRFQPVDQGADESEEEGAEPSSACRIVSASSAPRRWKPSRRAVVWRAACPAQLVLRWAGNGAGVRAMVRPVQPHAVRGRPRCGAAPWRGCPVARAARERAEGLDAFVKPAGAVLDGAKGAGRSRAETVSGDLRGGRDGGGRLLHAEPATMPVRPCVATRVDPGENRGVTASSAIATCFAPTTASAQSREFSVGAMRVAIPCAARGLERLDASVAESSPQHNLASSTLQQF